MACFMELLPLRNPGIPSPIALGFKQYSLLSQRYDRSLLFPEVTTFLTSLLKPTGFWVQLIQQCIPTTPYLSRRNV